MRVVGLVLLGLIGVSVAAATLAGVAYDAWTLIAETGWLGVVLTVGWPLLVGLIVWLLNDY